MALRVGAVVGKQAALGALWEHGEPRGVGQRAVLVAGPHVTARPESVIDKRHHHKRVQ